MEDIDLAAISLPVTSGYPARRVWFRHEAVLGRKQGDSSASLRVWTESEEVDFAIPDALVSRRHARVFFEAKRLFIQDLGSTNKTWINGTAIPWVGKGRKGSPQPLPEVEARMQFGPRALLDLSVKRYCANEVPGAILTARNRGTPTTLPDLDYVRSLSHASIEAIIALAPVEKARMITEIVRLKAFAGMTPDQILAAISEKRPEAVLAFHEMAAGAANMGKLDLYERLVQELKDSAQRQQEDYRLVFEKMESMWLRVLGTIKEVSQVTHRHPETSGPDFKE